MPDRLKGVAVEEVERIKVLTVDAAKSRTSLPAEGRALQGAGERLSALLTIH